MDTNIKYLVDNGINIWNKDAYNYYKKISKYHNSGIDFKSFIEYIKKGDLSYEDGSYKLGDLGRVYGAQWRWWSPTVNDYYNGDEEKRTDQISNLIKNLKEQPMSRRHIVTAWNPAELDDMALPPCHWSFEIIVEPYESELKRWKKIMSKEEFECKFPYFHEHSEKYQFTLKWHQRSVDTYLGLPFNIASYALLAHIIGKLTNMVPKALIGDLSNVHLYENSWDVSKELLKRNPDKYELPKLGIMEHLKFNSLDELDIWRIQDFKLLDYKSYGNIPVEMLSPKELNFK